LQIGSQAGYSLLWVLAWATAMGLFFQVLASRVGVVSGEDVAQLMRRSLPPPLRVPLWLVIETAIIGSDIQEVLGCAIAISVLSNGAIPLWAGTLLTATDSFAFLFLEEAGVRYLEGFFAALVGVMAVSFGVMAAEAVPAPAQLLYGTLVPSLTAANVPVRWFPSTRT
jgi:NRAMP (natural resistance-associated macrophage protein)-like metal ion transporter